MLWHHLYIAHICRTPWCSLPVFPIPPLFWSSSPLGPSMSDAGFLETRFKCPMPPPDQGRFLLEVQGLQAESYSNARGEAQRSGSLLGCASFLKELDEVWLGGSLWKLVPEYSFAFKCHLLISLFLTKERRETEKKECHNGPHAQLSYKTLV